MQRVTDFGLKLVHTFPLLAAHKITALWEEHNGRMSVA